MRPRRQRGRNGYWWRRRAAVAAAGLTLVAATELRAHEEPHLHETAAHWTWDPWASLMLCALGAGYGLGLARLWRRAGVGHGVRRWQASCFAAAWLVLVAALVSPVDALSDILFSVHMAQHELLMLIAAPLFVLGTPYRVLVTALPERARPALLAGLRRPILQTAWRTLTAPVIALLLQIAILSVWHIPQLFEAALRSEFVHTLQHAGFFLTAALFWWALVAGRYGRIGYGAGLLFVFLIALHGGTLGALLTVARGTWYPTHAERTRAAGLDALSDQQLAGLLMWVPGGVLLLAAALALGIAWLGALERRVERQAFVVAPRSTPGP